jgi:hypothetical protein
MAATSAALNARTVDLIARLTHILADIRRNPFEAPCMFEQRAQHLHTIQGGLTAEAIAEQLLLPPGDFLGTNAEELAPSPFLFDMRLLPEAGTPCCFTTAGIAASQASLERYPRNLP